MLTITLAALGALSTLANAIDLRVNSTASIRNASSTVAYGLMSWYQNNQSSTAETAVGTFPQPLYWWEAGAVWGGMIDYFAYTNDSSYNPTVTQALQAQVGPDDNYMPPAYFTSLGNDDQSFWAMAVLSAVEYGYPNPPQGQPQWLALAKAVFDTQAARWDTSTCGGGLRWQIFQSNAGYDYKNSVSNGAFFQIAARLGHFTGNQTYIDWADRAWDWMNHTGLFDQNYNVFDGTDPKINCTQLDHTEWTYNPAILIYGTAMMYNYTNGSSVWEERTSGLLTASVRNFFSMENATNILFEAACEPYGTCDNDQYSFKAYMSRWLAKSAIVAPYIADEVRTLITRSASAAANACSGGENGVTCGQKWYVGGYDGSYGVGQELSALETIQALLLLHGDVTTSHRYPRTQSNVRIDTFTPTSTYSVPSATAAPTTSPGSGGGGRGQSSNGDRANLGSRTGLLDWSSWSLLALPFIASAWGAGVSGVRLGR